MIIIKHLELKLPVHARLVCGVVIFLWDSGALEILQRTLAESVQAAEEGVGQSNSSYALFVRVVVVVVVVVMSSCRHPSVSCSHAARLVHFTLAGETLGTRAPIATHRARLASHFLHTCAEFSLRASPFENLFLHLFPCFSRSLPGTPQATLFTSLRPSSTHALPLGLADWPAGRCACSGDVFCLCGCFALDLFRVLLCKCVLDLHQQYGTGIVEPSSVGG